ncbi:MAG: TraR/DksA C4-type zinc finger protein [Chloroflexi bacterium]|nr:TraR/DksA C4-type zinc finger protein [Chloroflexota bacterium]MBI3741846.1 TraR/DksA C4-type zinc finger protein [Chloroflexota bacterium]
MKSALQLDEVVQHGTRKGACMSKGNSHEKKSARKNFAHHVVNAARRAKTNARALLNNRVLPPVKIEPRVHDSPALRALHKEEKRLREEIRHQEMIAQDHPTTGNHMADDATEVSEQAKTFALRRHLEGMLKEVQRAIVRAEKGMYGLCEACGNPIAEERLKVMPHATLCIEHAKMQTRALKAAA